MSKNKKKIVNCSEAEVSAAIRASTFDHNVHAAPKMILDDAVKSKGDKKKELKDDQLFLRPTISSINRRTNPHPASSSCGMPKPTKKGSNNNRMAKLPNKKLGGQSNSSTNLLDSDIEKSLQDEITELVLLRLPAIELVRHKKLQPIISSPRFASAHLKHFKSDPSSHYLLVRDSMMIYISDVLPLGPLDSIVCCTSPHLVIVGSVNGLICFAGVSRSYPTPDDIFILNPVTRLSRKLPSPSKSRITHDTRSVNLAFWWNNDDSDSTTGGGGGAYKVAKIVTIPNVQCMLELWDSSNPDIWTDITALYFNFNYWVTTRSLPHPCDVLIEGDAAYWMVRNHQENLYVLSLDLNSLGVKFIALSKQQMITQSELYAWRGQGPISTHLFCASCNGNLVLLRNRFSGDRFYDIWTMARTAGGGDFCWFKCQRPIRLDFGFFDCVGSINGELILRGFNDILAMYDLRTGRKTRLVEDSNLKYVRILSAHDFVGSLVSIEGFGSNNLPRVGVTWPSPYFGDSGWVKKENVEIL